MEAPIYPTYLKRLEELLIQVKSDLEKEPKIVDFYKVTEILELLSWRTCGISLPEKEEKWITTTEFLKKYPIMHHSTLTDILKLCRSKNLPWVQREGHRYLIKEKETVDGIAEILNNEYKYSINLKKKYDDFFKKSAA